MSLNRTFILVATVLCVVGIVAFFFTRKAEYSQQIDREQPLIEHANALPDPTPNNHNYKEILATLAAERQRLAVRYQEASFADQRSAVIAESRTLLTQTIYSDLFPSWYGTRWDFNGTTETPQQGKIACGYFVSTVLRDAGLKVERARLAQQASENIILSLTGDTYVRRFRRVEIRDFVDVVKQWGPGIYVVGLDIHVGFIVNTGSEVYFIHSSYVEPYMVVKEEASESRILAASNYRVLGKISADDSLIEKWLLGTEIATRR